MPQHLIIAIPSRLASSRLPEKALVDLWGKPLIARVCEQAKHLMTALKAHPISQSWKISAFVATDDMRIAVASQKVGIESILTPADLPSGTDRVAFALKQKEDESGDVFPEESLIVNIQGDEPMFCIEDTLKCIHNTHALQTEMGTLGIENHSGKDFLTPSIVKIVANTKRNMALSFSRAPVPWPREFFGAAGVPCQPSSQKLPAEFSFIQHIGLYVYRRRCLLDFAVLKEPGTWERHEGLEQLRALEAGWKIALTMGTEAHRGIDTKEDLERLRKEMENR